MYHYNAPSQPGGRFIPPSVAPQRRVPVSVHILWIAACLLFSGAAFVAGFGIGQNQATPAQTPTQASVSVASTAAPTQANQPASQSAHHKVGDTVALDGIWQMTVVSASTGDDNLAQPKAGHVLLFIEVAMKNIDKEQHGASSVIQFALRGADGTVYTQGISSKPAPDGTVNPGEPLKGTLTYEVPSNVKQFTLGFIARIGGTQATYDITVK